MRIIFWRILTWHPPLSPPLAFSSGFSCRYKPAAVISPSFCLTWTMLQPRGLFFIWFENTADAKHVGGWSAPCPVSSRRLIWWTLPLQRSYSPARGDSGCLWTINTSEVGSSLRMHANHKRKYRPFYFKCTLLVAIHDLDVYYHHIHYCMNRVEDVYTWDFPIVSDQDASGLKYLWAGAAPGHQDFIHNLYGDDCVSATARANNMCLHLLGFSLRGLH